MNAAVALRMLASTQMRSFDNADWDAFAGCESEDPLIGSAEFGGKEYILIVDGRYLQVYNENAGVHMFAMESLG